MSRKEPSDGKRHDDASHGFSDGLIERGSDDRISLRRILVPGGLFALALLYILGGLVWRQLIGTTDFDEEFHIQSSRVIQLPAPRGCIFDRNGKLLVGNRPRFNIVADLGMLREDIYKEYKRRVGLATFSRVRTERLREIGVLRSQARVAVLQRYLDRVNRVLERNETVDPAAVEKHIKTNLALDFPLVSDIDPATEVPKFVENFPEDSPLRLYVDSVRDYPHGDCAAHVLGYLGNTDDLGDAAGADPAVAELLRMRQARDRRSDSLFIKYPGKIGVSGLELSCNDQLQGKPGSQVWMVNPNGYLYKKLSETKAEQGSHVYCSLDLDLQLAAEKILANQKTDSKEQLKGAVIAMDIGTGEILAMASYPRFDPNKFADRVSASYLSELKETGGEVNRATKGLYPPGSTFKIVTAIAGMRSDKLDPDEILECGSYFDIGGRKWPEHDGAAFGAVNLEKMIQVSCNVYCYQMGLRIGVVPLAAEAKRLGLDSKINLEIETAPKRDLIVADPAWARAREYKGWSSGDTANMAIGQGYLRTTPLHMASMIAAVAADRTRTEPTLIHDPAKDGLNLSQHADPLGLTAYQRKRLLDGLRACVQRGTGKVVNIPGADIVGKTGTAEFPKKGKNVNLAWFEGFAPGDNPKVAVLVMLEGEHDSKSLHGGKSAGPVAKAVFEQWLKEQHPEAAPAP